MKNLLLQLALMVFLGGCAVAPPPRPTDPTKQAEYDAFHAGGPVFAPSEIGVGEPPPVDPPFGKYFSNDQPDQPPAMRDPYWITGYWAWKSNAWEWISGRWVERPRPGLIWINARYTSGARQIWQTGYWQ